MAKKKKKSNKKKQKPVPRFLEVMNRSTDGVPEVRAVPMAEAVTEFGNPIMDFIGDVMVKQSEPDMNLLQDGIQVIQAIWSGANNGYSVDILDSLKAAGRAGELFDWDKLLPVMYDYHRKMFPDFEGMETDVVGVINQCAVDETINVFEYLSTAITDKFPSAPVSDESGDEAFDMDVELGALEAKVADEPENVGVYLEYGRALTCEEHFARALAQFEQGYQLIPEHGSNDEEKMFISEILDCLNQLGREYTDFPWRTQPELMSPSEFEQKMFTCVIQRGGRVPLMEAIGKVLGSKFMEPGGDTMAQVLKGERMHMVSDQSGMPMIELL